MAVLTLAASKVKTWRSFQFEMFLFAFVLFVSEVPHILNTLGLISTLGYEAFGLTVHTFAMVVLSFFVAVRIYGFVKRQ